MAYVRSAVVALFALASGSLSCTSNPHGGFATDDGGAPSSEGGSGGNGFIVNVDWHQDPQSEILQCHYLKVPNDAPAEIGHLKLTFPQGSHHVHVYHASIDVPDHTEDCTAIDWS